MPSPVQITPPPLSSQAMADLLCTIVLLCRGSDQGKDFWAYLCIKPSMAQAFMEARHNEPFTLTDFGTILESGEGLDVPSEVMGRMERDYGVNHRYEEALLEAVAAAQKKIGD